MKNHITKEMIEELKLPENIKKLKESQEKAKLLFEQLKKSLVIDLETYRRPFDI